MGAFDVVTARGNSYGHGHREHRLQGELVKLQDWIAHTGEKLVVIFEGRDAAGRGGVISASLSASILEFCRVAALPDPNDQERTQWYFQRYVAHLLAGGKLLFQEKRALSQAPEDLQRVGYLADLAGA